MAAWVEGCRAQLLRGETAQIDIDALLDPSPTEAVRVGIECLELAAAMAREIDEFIGALLVVPLAWVEQDLPPLDHPALATILGGVWTYQPGLEVPGLYLVHPELLRAHEAVEEYRIGLDEPRLLREGLAAYYRAWRTDEEKKLAPKEWNRAIYIRTT